MVHLYRARARKGTCGTEVGLGESVSEARGNVKAGTLLSSTVDFTKSAHLGHTNV